MIGGVGQLRQPEIENLDAVIVRHEQVVGFQIAVHDAVRVSGRKTFRHLTRVLDGAARRQSRVAETGPERFPGEEFGDQVRPAVVAADIVHCQHVGMIESAGRAGFVLEPAHARIVCREVLGNHLDRDVASEARVTGPIDLAHAAGTDPFNDLERADPDAAGEGH